jgi:hypothetical protein
LRFDYLETNPKASLEYIDECLRAPILRLVQILNEFPDVDSGDFDRSTTIRGGLATKLSVAEGWQANFLGLESIPRTMPNKNYVIDFIFDGSCSDCKKRHRLFVEVCFDNRQAIGTNILKLDSAASFFQDKTSGVALSVIVCADRKALSTGGWDSGVGDEEEYQIALNTAYKKHLKTNISLLIMRVAGRVD